MQMLSTLTPGALLILQMIAAGKSYEQILDANPNLTYLDIFHAAQEAIRNCTPDQPQEQSSLKRHSRAGEPWTPAEESQLRALVESGHTVARISGHLQRKRSAIRSRILKLNLTTLLPPSDQRRLHRHATKYPPSAKAPELSHTSTSERP